MLQPQRPQQHQRRRRRPQLLQRRRRLHEVDRVDREKGIDVRLLLAFYPFWMIVQSIFNVNGDDLLNDLVDQELISMPGRKTAIGQEMPNVSQSPQQ